MAGTLSQVPLDKLQQLIGQATAASRPAPVYRPSTSDERVALSEQNRPGFEQFGPNGQFYQPIYIPQYTDFAPNGPQTQSVINPVVLAAGIPTLLNSIGSGDMSGIQRAAGAAKGTSDGK